MGLFSRNKPKIKVENKKKDSFSGWIQCSGCTELIHVNELKNSFHCCPKCQYHYRISVEERIQLLTDENSFTELFQNLSPVDSLNFVDTEPYQKRIKDSQEKTDRKDAVVVGTAKIQNIDVALGVLDFNFMGGSMGSVVGEKITLMIEYAAEKKLPVIIVSASGGARMQESVLSLMQMAKTSAALARLHDKNLPYISILTNPTTGGVTASFASLGDIILAEPEALIAFAGPRVVEQTIGQKLPPGAQKAEFLLEKGMIDCIVKREDLKKKIAFFLEFFMNNEKNVFPAKESLDEKISERLKELLKFSEEGSIIQTLDP
jgi:acetyl-CoA carboxylase carboxyl transferase subunit beta